MFGCCVAGRLLQTNLQQIDDTHAAFELPAAGSINHICVFLLGTGALLSPIRPPSLSSYIPCSLFPLVLNESNAVDCGLTYCYLPLTVTLQCRFQKATARPCISSGPGAASSCSECKFSFHHAYLPD